MFMQGVLEFLRTSQPEISVVPVRSLDELNHHRVILLAPYPNTFYDIVVDEGNIVNLNSIGPTFRITKGKLFLKNYVPEQNRAECLYFGCIDILCFGIKESSVNDGKVFLLCHQTQEPTEPVH